jgi:Tol biopolymer transport system component
MIAGSPPFDGATTSDVITAILKEEPVPIAQHSPQVPAEVEWMVKKALAKDCEERYQTIRELYIDLKRLRQELELLAKLDGMSPAGLQRGATGTRSAGQAIDDLMLEAVARKAVADSTDGEIKPHKRNIVSRSKALVVALAAITVFSLVSFYVGLKQQISSSHPTFRQLTFRRGTITKARFAPDGQTIIYSAAFDGKPVGLFRLRLEGPESSRVKLQGGERAAGIQSISSTGEMAILLDCELDWGKCDNGTLAQVMLDSDTPRERTENVYDADWSPDGKELAIIRVVEREYQLEYPIGKALYKARGKISDMRVSPKGDMVAFIDHQRLGNWGGSIMLADRDGNNRTLSAGWNSTNGLAWSPTGDEVWFSAGRSEVIGLYAVTTSGRERLVLQGPGNIGLHDISRDGRVLLHRGVPYSRMMFGSTSSSEKERNLSWFDYSTSADISVDGKRLLFYEWGMAVAAVPYVYLRTMDGSNDPVRLGQGRALALSPDGKWALALQESSPQQLVLLPTVTGESRLLSRGNINEYHYASWFPDGKRILFTGRAELGHGLRSYVQETAGGPPQPITEEGVIALSVSPDGKRLFAWAPDKGLYGRYYLFPLDQTQSPKPTPINGLETGEIPIQWSADARALYVRSYGDSDTRIYKVDLSTGRRELVKEIVPDPVGLIGLEVNPGGVQITPDGKSYVYTYWTALRDLFLAEGLK